MTWCIFRDILNHFTGSNLRKIYIVEHLTLSFDARTARKYNLICMLMMNMKLKNPVAMRTQLWNLIRKTFTLWSGPTPHVSLMNNPSKFTYSWFPSPRGWQRRLSTSDLCRTIYAGIVLKSIAILNSQLHCSETSALRTPDSVQNSYCIVWKYQIAAFSRLSALHSDFVPLKSISIRNVIYAPWKCRCSML